MIREKALEKHGMPIDLTLHSARHTFATMALESGWSYEEVARQLHHHSGAFTAMQYAHTSDRRPPMEWADLAAVPEVPEWQATCRNHRRKHLIPMWDW